MKRLLSAIVLAAVAALPVHGHFIWLVPNADKGTVQMIFSDTLAPDENGDIDKIKQTQVYSSDGAGKVSAAKFTKGEAAMVLTLPEGKEARVLAAACKYGVIKRGEGEPFLLNYFAKTFVGAGGKDVAKQFAAADEKLDLAIAFGDKPGSMRVLWQGKPLARAKVVVKIGRNTAEEMTDEDGAFPTAKLKDAEGLVGIRVNHVVKEAGEYDGKKYAEKRYWSTLVFDANYFKLKQGGERQSRVNAVLDRAELKEDADATKLLADARAARANWDDFPGFSANVELNVEGNVVKGKVEVDAKGKVSLEGVDDEKAAAWIKRQMASIVGHRMADGGSLKTPCTFLANDQDHPLGRAIQVLNDEFHSSYRIRDRQVIVVNRTMKDARFTITVLENKLTAEKTFLPAHYVVNTWELKSNALKSSQTFFHDWTRVGKFDLPGTSMIVSATSDGKLEARKLVLSGHKLK